MTLFRRPKRLPRMSVPSGKTLAVITPILAYVIGETVKGKALRALLLSLLAAFSAFLSDPEVQEFFAEPPAVESVPLAQALPPIPTGLPAKGASPSP